MPWIEANHTRLHYRHVPHAGKPVLLLSHSLFFDQSMFDPLIEQLAQDFDIISYDHRAHGESDGNGARDMDTLSDDALALMNALGVQAFYVAGNSMGGFIALRLAIRHPERVKGCIVMGSSADRELRRLELEPLVELIAQQGMAAHIDTLMHIMFGDSTLTEPAHAPLAAHWRERLLALPSDIAHSARCVLQRGSVIEQLPSLRPPLLVVAGAQDHAYTVAQSEEIVAHCGHGHCVVIEQAGHSVALEAPQAVAEHIRHWLRQH